ncbi:hypothetical protein ANANSI_47 [Arthrobacter phage Anansi]|uniref:Uncharacterized protein n=3 Tax=Amigovirus amigo TaxID=1982100 RepID=A0A0U4KAV0_9CAUD|nr:hypothetical protein ANANSI_47 [Arthrobacter phage Anansi]ALY09106.1 hypothetical protein GORGEOUS_47 [Arthrobacter phage Gorgeous]ALY10387.1 hypothetical protein SORJUANA_47 [Arthrobacter phage SorJuana]
MTNIFAKAWQWLTRKDPGAEALWVWDDKAKLDDAILALPESPVWTVGTPDTGLKYEDIPWSCTCDWVSERMICQRPEDERFTRGMRDPHCPYHPNGL